MRVRKHPNLVIYSRVVFTFSCFEFADICVHSPKLHSFFRFEFWKGLSSRLFPNCVRRGNLFLPSFLSKTIFLLFLFLGTILVRWEYGNKAQDVRRRRRRTKGRKEKRKLDRGDRERNRGSWFRKEKPLYEALWVP